MANPSLCLQCALGKQSRRLLIVIRKPVGSVVRTAIAKGVEVVDVGEFIQLLGRDQSRYSGGMRPCLLRNPLHPAGREIRKPRFLDAFDRKDARGTGEVVRCVDARPAGSHRGHFAELI